MVFVYPYIRSTWGEELRYSLRSLEKYYRGDFEVCIIGETHPWIQNVAHIEWDDDRSRTSEQNHGPKLKWSLEQYKRFIWINDDCYLLRRMDHRAFSYPRIVEDLEKTTKRGRSRWQKLLWATFDRCKDLGYTGFNAETHAPYYYESEALQATLKTFKIEQGIHLAHTAYFNMYPDGREPYVMDDLVGIYDTKGSWPITRKSLFLNHDDRALSGMKSVLPLLFPHPSRFEKDVLSS